MSAPSSDSKTPAVSSSAKKRKARSSNDNNDVHASLELLKPLGQAPPRTGLAFRMAMEQQSALGSSKNNLNNNNSEPGNNNNASKKTPVSLISLQEACRHAIVANLERFPPDSMAVLDSEEWNLLVKNRHTKTQPKTGTGGLDGTGRQAPALSDKYLAAVEASHPEVGVRESSVADVLLWKDCVNFRFPLRTTSHSLSRPKVLQWPWPLWIQRIQDAGAVLLDPPLTQAAREQGTGAAATTATTTTISMEEAMQTLESSPMNVNLLMASSIGKTLKKAFKKQQKREQQQQQQSASSALYSQRMQALLEHWKTMAHREGVVAASSPNNDTKPPPSKKKKTEGSGDVDANSNANSNSNSNEYQKEDWERAEACHTWRQLFDALKLREDKRRGAQGAKMRQIRKNLNSSRPKVVKVRPAGYSKPHHERILQHSSPAAAAAASPANRKMAQLKREVQVTTHRVNRGDATNQARLRQQASASASRGGGVFAMAVAGAAGQKNKGKRRPARARTQMPAVQKSARHKTHAVSPQRRRNA